MASRRKQVAASLLSTALLPLTACGDDDGNSSTLSCTDRGDDQVIVEGPEDPRHRLAAADLVSVALEITDDELTVTWTMAIDVDEELGGAYDVILRGNDLRSLFWFRASFAELGPHLTLHGPAPWSPSEKASTGTDLPGRPTVSGGSVTATFPLDALPHRESLTLWTSATHLPHPGIGAVVDTCPDGLVGGGSGGTADWLRIRLA